jgi:hypothetical protein
MRLAVLREFFSGETILLRCIRSTLYSVWCYKKQGRFSVKKRTPIWWAELYLALNPPGHGFPVLEAPEQRRWNDVCSAEDLLGFDIAYRAYHAWKLEGTSNLESTILLPDGM